MAWGSVLRWTPYMPQSGRDESRTGTGRSGRTMRSFGCGTRPGLQMPSNSLETLVELPTTGPDRDSLRGCLPLSWDLSPYCAPIFSPTTLYFSPWRVCFLPFRVLTLTRLAVFISLFSRVHGCATRLHPLQPYLLSLSDASSLTYNPHPFRDFRFLVRLSSLASRAIFDSQGDLTILASMIPPSIRPIRV
ncbi:hypothetical protein VTN02DRAFT_2966 [Thermoascus thermophilus]